MSAIVGGVYFTNMKLKLCKQKIKIKHKKSEKTNNFSKY